MSLKHSFIFSRCHPFVLAIGISSILHGICLFMFQITVYIPFDRAPLFPTPSIAIDQEAFVPLETTPLIIHGSTNSIEQELIHLKSHGIDLDQSTLISAMPELMPSSLETSESYIPPFVPWSYQETDMPSKTPHRLYPIKINQLYGIKNLELINDASDLFKQATETSLTLTTQFCHTKPKVEFFVELDSTTGKISLFFCVKELVDKRLQNLALHIIKTIRFRTTPEQLEKKPISGMISLQFNGVFDSLLPYIRKEVLKTL